MFDTGLLTTRRAEATARLLRVLGNPQRLLVLCRLLKAGESSAGELARRLGLSASALSQHLSRMREESLVLQRREGRTLYYRINEQLDVRLPALLESICADDDVEESSVNRMNRTAAVVGLAFASTMEEAGGQDWQTPVITHAGRMQSLPQAAYQPDPDAVCKVVFAMTRGSDEPGQVNPALQRVARTVNLYAHAGVPLEHMDFVSIASAKATAMVLGDEYYKEQYGIANPNLPVIRELRNAGIDVAVCGQAVTEHQYQYDWVDSDVTMALSSLTTVTELQRKGYALMPL